MSFPPPRATLAGCMWLPRLLAKARAHQDGSLPPEYARSFAQAPAVDGQFLAFFGLTIEQVLQAPADAEAWFLALPGVDAAKIQAWNELAVSLGRPGYPMAERMAAALQGTYAHVDPARRGSVFEVLEADEGL